MPGVWSRALRPSADLFRALPSCGDSPAPSRLDPRLGDARTPSFEDRVTLRDTTLVGLYVRTDLATRPARPLATRGDGQGPAQADLLVARAFVEVPSVEGSA